MLKKYSSPLKGFTIVELLVAISIIGILSSIVYANFGEARKASRDDVRKTSLKELQLAIEFYKAQNDRYPDAGCGVAAGTYAEASATCVDYISGLIPDYIPALPRDPNSENDAGVGFMYRTNASGSDYKLMVKDAIEVKFTVAGDEYANGTNDSNTYAVYSAGGVSW
ncbi:prepilin-type N-terminal cleavage/methylation domain-containing protein [Patescibacteria group bacterium]|nr:prepilin-type N-terminal cleavage/methylation domain-containing protein [Patescibacteria group bacterium]